MVSILSFFSPIDALLCQVPDGNRVPTLTKECAPTRVLFRKLTSSCLSVQSNDDGDRNPLSYLLNPYNSKIPKEIAKDIYQAEANTAAAKDRKARVAWYSLLAVVGLFFGFFNYFISELRFSETPDGVPFDLEGSSFAWVDGNSLTKFLFMNKIGGALSLLFGAGSGLLAEAELDTRRINSEKIYEELIRRREGKEKGQAVAAQPKRKKKRRSTKETKRLGALVEVMDRVDDGGIGSGTNQSVAATKDSDGNKSVAASTRTSDNESEVTREAAPNQNTNKFVDKIKGFYEQADNMAASQALLLNKRLEDSGIIEKITDETGFRVVGREEAKQKMRQDKSEE